jgi:hypothetical protein
MHHVALHSFYKSCQAAQHFVAPTARRAITGKTAMPQSNAVLLYRYRTLAALPWSRLDVSQTSRPEMGQGP